MSARSTTTRRTVLALAGAGVLAGCAPSIGTPTADRTGPGIPDDGIRECTFTTWSLNEASTKDLLGRMVAAYAADSGVRIDTASYPYNEFLNQVLLQLRGGALDGAVQLDVAWLATLAATGRLTDLAPLAGDAGYTAAALNLGRVHGVQYGLPWTSAGIGLIANTELLGRAGVAAPPATIAEFESTLAALHRLGDGVVPYAAMTKVAQLKDIIAWLWTFGCEVVRDGRVVLGDDASVEALTWYKKLSDGGLIARDVDRFDARAMFGQGKVGFYDDAIAGRAAVLKASSDRDLAGKIQAMARPVRSAGDTPRNLAWGHVVVVLRGPGASAAARFARALTSDPKYTVDWFRQAGLPPTTTAGIAAPEVRSDPFTVEFTARIGAYTAPSPLWAYPQYAQLEQILGTQVQTALIGRASPKAALTEARVQMQALIG